MAAPGPALVQPVFLLNKTLPAVEEKDYSVAEICAAAERTAGFETVEGTQRIGVYGGYMPRTMRLESNF